MLRYDMRVHQLELRARMLRQQMGELVHDASQLANLQSAMKLAFAERVGREYRSSDDFTEWDEKRAEELLEMFPGASA